MYGVCRGAGAVKDEIKPANSPGLTILFYIDAPAIESVSRCRDAGPLKAKFSGTDVAYDCRMNVGRCPVAKTIPDRAQMPVKARLIFCGQALPEGLRLRAKPIDEAAPVFSI